MTALEELDLSYNELTTLPPELASCGMIQMLNLRNNCIEGCLPHTIGLVESLVHIDISFNPVDEVPRSMIGLNMMEVREYGLCCMFGRLLLYIVVVIIHI